MSYVNFPYQTESWPPPWLYPWAPQPLPLDEITWTLTTTPKEIMLTDITVVLDKSGSMASRQNDTIGSFNQFLKEQQSNENPAKFTLIQFNNEWQTIGTVGGDLQHARMLNTDNYRPMGGTALLDALGAAISGAQSRVKVNGAKQVVIVVITDGEENSSRNYTLSRVKQLVKEAELGGWQFIFLGANIDAFSVGQSLGMPMASVAQFNMNEQSIGSTYTVTSDKLLRYRSGLESSMAFTEAERSSIDI